MSDNPPTQEEARRLRKVLSLCSDGSRVNTGQYGEHVNWALLTRRIRYGPYSYAAYSELPDLRVECKVTAPARRKWLRKKPGVEVIVFEAPGPWWVAFRELLPQWEAEVLLPENVGWKERAREQRHAEKLEQARAERQAKIDRARKLLG